MEDIKEKSDVSTKYYQWIKGDYAPNIEVFEREITLGTDIFIVFESGKQVNKGLIGEYVDEINSPDNPTIDPARYVEQQRETTQTNKQISEQVRNEQHHTGLEQVKTEKEGTNLGNADIIPHPDDIQGMEEYRRKHQLPSSEDEFRPLNQKATKPTKKTDPILDLVENAKKTEYECEIKLNLKLPSKEFLSVLLDSFENKEKLIVTHLINSIKKGNLDSELEKFIKEFLNLKKEDENAPK